MAVRKFIFINTLIFCVAFSAFAQERTHILKKGETLYSLARMYGVSFSAIVEANNIVDANKVVAGQKIKIPSPAGDKTTQSLPAATPAASVKDSTSSLTARHRVAKGETMYSISRQYDMSVAELQAANKLNDKSVIKVGDSLVVKQLKTPPQTEKTTPAAEKTVSLPSSGKSTPAKTDELRPLTPKKSDSNLKWPVSAKELSYIDGKLYGVLITGEKSEKVVSLTAGTVVSADVYRGFGRVAIVQAPNGYVYVYGGNESLSVKTGDRIYSGSELGRLGIDSLSGRPSLFFFVYKNNVAIDPAKAPRT